LTHDGVVGLGPIEQCKRSLGLAIAAEKYGSRFFGNAAHPGGVLSTKDELDEDERERVRQSIEDGYRGHKQLSLMLLDGDWHYQPLGIPPEQAQFLQTRVKQDADVCRIFGVPPWLIGVPVEGSKPYANVEQEMINFVVLTIRPLLVRLESTINAQLFPMIPGRGREYFFEILVDGLLRGDGVSRFQRYQLGVRNGIYSPNEVRELENLSPYDGGDVYASQQAETAVHEEGGA
jgi:HK97 family phage portal protein